MIRPSRSRTPTACSTKRRCRCHTRRFMGLPKSRCRPWFRHSRSAASLPRWFFSKVRRSTCLRRSASPSSLRCSRLTACRVPLTPITIGLLLKGQSDNGAAGGPGKGFFSRFHAAFERGFEHLREGYVGLLTMLLTRRAIVPVLAVLVLSLGAAMFVFVGRDFYPA